MRCCWSVVILGACEPAPPTRPPSNRAVGVPELPAVHARELFDHPEWIGHEVRVELDEPFFDSDHSSAAAPGELDVEVADVGSRRLALAAADHRALPTTTHPPIRVLARLEATDRDLRLVASKLEPLAFPAPVHLARARDILRDPKRWSGAFVTFEDDSLVGFEASYFDGSIWLDLYPDAKVTCPPPPSPNLQSSAKHRVRVVGFAHTMGSYGHMNMSSGEITATELVYLDPARPECR